MAVWNHPQRKAFFFISIFITSESWLDGGVLLDLKESLCRDRVICELSKHFHVHTTFSVVHNGFCHPMLQYRIYTFAALLHPVISSWVS